MRQRTFRLLISAPLFLLLYSCESSDEVKLNLPINQPVVVTGLELKDVVGNTMGTIGKPNSKTLAKVNGCQVSIDAFPVPFGGSMSLSFHSSCSHTVSIFIVAAANNNIEKAQVVSSAILPATQKPPVAFFKRVPFKSGYNHFDINFRDIDHQSLPSGYYRIYLDVDGTYLWTDTYYAVDCETTPDYLKAMLPYLCQ